MPRPKPLRQALAPPKRFPLDHPQVRLRATPSIRRRRTFAFGVPVAAALSVAIVGGLPGSYPAPALTAGQIPGGAASGQRPREDEAPGAQGQPPATTGSSGHVASGGAQRAGLAGALGAMTAMSVEPERLTGYSWPVRDGQITSFFSLRRNGFLMVDGRRIHEGLDVTTFCGDHVRAAHDGVVLAAGRRALADQAFISSMAPYYQGIERRGSLADQSYSVVIDDGNGYRSVYAHLWDATVKPGDVVKAGDHIGYEGATGFATGCHLHYELIRMDGPWMGVAPDLVDRFELPAWTRERIDPMRVLQLDQPGAPTYLWGVRPPKRSPGLGRRTAPAVLEGDMPEPGPDLEPPPMDVSPGGAWSG